MIAIAILFFKIANIRVYKILINLKKCMELYIYIYKVIIYLEHFSPPMF